MLDAEERTIYFKTIDKTVPLTKSKSGHLLLDLRAFGIGGYQSGEEKIAENREIEVFSHRELVLGGNGTRAERGS